MKAIMPEVPPSVVVEIESPNDQIREKLPFYSKIGVPEVWIVDRDSRSPEIHSLAGSGYLAQEADNEGWLTSSATGVRMRWNEAANRVVLELSGDETTREELPEG